MCVALHVSCCWVSNISVEPGDQELVGPVWTWLGEAESAHLSIAAVMGVGKAESGTEGAQQGSRK